MLPGKEISVSFSKLNLKTVKLAVTIIPQVWFLPRVIRAVTVTGVVETCIHSTPATLGVARQFLVVWLLEYFFSENYFSLARFQFLTAMSMKRAVFWFVPCSLVGNDRCMFESSVLPSLSGRQFRDILLRNLYV